MKTSRRTCPSVGDPVVPHFNRGGVPADGDGGGGGGRHGQVSGSIRDWKTQRENYFIYCENTAE